MELKKVMLSIGVGILAALFIGFLIDAIYPAPKYEDYCNNQYYSSPMVKDQATCNYTYDIPFENNCSNSKGMVQYGYDSKGCVINETCDFCSRDYTLANENYSRNLFYITAPLGLILIILGLYLPIAIDAIASGILLGGILTMLQITMRIFGDLGKWPRVFLLGLELALVIWIGIKKVSDFTVSKSNVSKKKKK
jgi:hypothetical protein